jgi:hypothetical protein
MEKWRGRACSRALHRGLRIAWKGKLGSGSGWALCENAGGGTRKVRGWQRGQKSLRRITLRRAGGPRRQKIENRIRSDWSRVFRASSAGDISVSSGPATKRVKLSGGSHISISPQIRVVWIRDAGGPTSFRGQNTPNFRSIRCTHRYLSTTTGAVMLCKMKDCGSRVPGCWRRAYSGSNGLKRGCNLPKLQQVVGAVDCWATGEFQKIGQELSADG